MTPRRLPSPRLPWREVLALWGIAALALIEWWWLANVLVLALDPSRFHLWASPDDPLMWLAVLSGLLALLARHWPPLQSVLVWAAFIPIMAGFVMPMVVPLIFIVVGHIGLRLIKTIRHRLVTGGHHGAPPGVG